MVMSEPFPLDFLFLWTFCAIWSFVTLNFFGNKVTFAVSIGLGFRFFFPLLIQAFWGLFSICSRLLKHVCLRTLGDGKTFSKTFEAVSHHRSKSPSVKTNYKPLLPIKNPSPGY